MPVPASLPVRPVLFQVPGTLPAPVPEQARVPVAVSVRAPAAR